MEGMRGIGRDAAIREGNDIAHTRDVVTDIHLLKNSLIEYHQTFAPLYGLHWRAAMKLVGHPHIVSAMNHGASIMAQAESRWTKQDEFVSIIAWTQNASSNDLAIFAADTIGATSAKRLFLRPMGDGS
ncbi:hypothetical protein HOY80DRAFT_997992 [Tuber brumale]|nr:hypothetical protein HOY80DRAFT_997992 [Tuber brumale]